MRPQRHSPLVPILLALGVIAGIALGIFINAHFSGNRLNIINPGSNKLNYLLQVIDNNYVDTVHIDELVEDAMPQILSELDPHSSYIPPKEAQQSLDDLKGSFSGIGVTFIIENDSVHIMSVIKGGPAEKVGLLAGDRIVTVDDSVFVGKKVTNEEAMKRLKGEKGSVVKLGIKRFGEPAPLTFRITRGDIPVHSVDAAYMMDDKTAYIKINKFGENTYPEMLTALARLAFMGMEGLVVDLRGNTGGLMQAPIQMVNLFLPEGRLIVYTEGRNAPREDFYSDGTGSFRGLPLVVLMDEASASASEIFAGAVQDNDRGTIIGRRSFGKGLVQQPIEFRDGSIVRLTIARYYTPSGRCIQKPYEKGKTSDYENDLITRYVHGEFFSSDSIHQQGAAYKTLLGRTVYGGGGIMPDIFVPEDTTGMTSYYKEALLSGLLRQFAFAYADNNRRKLDTFDDQEALEKYLRRQNLPEQFAAFADKRGLKRRNLMLRKSRQLFERNLMASIIYNARDMEAYLMFLNKTDRTVQRALRLIEEGGTFPQAPADSTAAGE